jgi:hypothetical protein
VRHAVAIAFAILAAVGCGQPTVTATPVALPAPAVTSAPIPRPAPTAIATVTFGSSGIKRCGGFPYLCTYPIQVRGPDDVLHGGWFDVPMSGKLPRSLGVVGDVPTALTAGRYRVTFLREWVSDVASSVPVPGGTPTFSNVGEVTATCDTDFYVVAPDDIVVKVTFDSDSCTAATTVRGRD